MDQATSNVRETAAFARRVVCRTLTVVGGVAAGTAIAWWLSTSSAAASVDPATPPAPEVPVVSEVVTPVADGVETTLTTVADDLQHPPPAPEDPLKELGERVREAADQFGGPAAGGVGQLPECDMSGCDLGFGRGTPPGYSDDGLGRADFQPTAPATAPVAAGAVSGPGVDLDAIADRTATGRALADGMNRRGSPAPDAPSLPDLPNWPAPFVPAPPSTPATGHNGQTGNPVDSQLCAALPWQDSSSDLVAGDTLPATEVTTVGRPGAQPGVTPD